MARISEQVEWLSLVDISGPFLAAPVLEDVFPQGLEKVDTPRRQRLRAAYDEWRDAADEDDPELAELHTAWIRMVLQEALEYEDEVLVPRERLDGRFAYRAPEHGVEMAPDFAVQGDDGKPRLLIAVCPPETDLEKPLPGDRWPASPLERMTAMCRANDVRVGLVTDGERWTVVNAPVGGTSGYAIWLARLWWQEPVTFRAFVSLLGVRRCFGAADQRLDQLLERSLAFQEEVTDTLGEQVRRAVEVLIQALGRADQDRNGELLEDVRPAELYEAGLTVMMRLVFILFAEERGLLLLGDPVYDQHYAISTLRARLREDESLYGPEVLERRHDAWSRILSVFRAVYGGVEHESLRLLALGGSLFDPDRFPFLEGRARGTCWRDTPAAPLPIDNRTVLLLLTALQVLEQRGGAQLLSYRALDVEQIGHVYEGLLEYTVARLPEVTVGLIGSRKVPHPTIALGELESLLAEGTGTAAKRLADLTGRSAAAIKKSLERGGDHEAFLGLIQACGGDEPLARRLLPFAELIRTDSWGSPVVYRAGAFAVARGPDRRETGTHYTPRSLTESIVEKTLEPIVYEGPAEGRARDRWHLKPPAELLDLKICDPAMGSGAFLVQACRYLSERLVEAWGRQEDAGRSVTVDGEVVDAAAAHELLPKDADERLLIARRLVAERCLYGVDLNPLAVELAKLSIWLVTLAKGRPFAFLDHNLRCGDSLLGIHRLDQLTKLTMDPDRPDRQQRLFGRNIEDAVRRAIELRLRLRRIRIRDIHDVEAMAHLFEEARHMLQAPSLIADAMIGEALRSGGNTSRLEAALDGLAIEAEAFLRGDGDAARSIQAGASDSLLVQTAEGNRKRRTFHWPLQFPEAFSRDREGFDAIVSNPPFASAPLRANMLPWLDCFRDIFAPFTDGAYDLVLLFWSRALQHLIRPGGCYGLVGPSAMLADDRQWQKCVSYHCAPHWVVLLPVDFFGAARVRTMAVCGAAARSGRQLTVRNRDPESPIPAEVTTTWPDEYTNWNGVFSGQHSMLCSSAHLVPLGRIADIQAACATAVAYELLPYIVDSADGRGARLHTTGAIDRFKSRWGVARIRYLKHDYMYPRYVERTEVPESVRRAMTRQVSPRIIAGGLTTVIEAWYDTNADSVGAKSTWLLRLTSDEWPAANWWLLGILNSASFSRLYTGRYGSRSMSGRQMTIQRDALKAVEVPVDVSDPHAALGALPRTWRIAVETIPPAVLIAAAAKYLQRTDESLPEWRICDSLLHALVGVCYWHDVERAVDDYRWWCQRVRRDDYPRDVLSVDIASVLSGLREDTATCSQGIGNGE